MHRSVSLHTQHLQASGGGSIGVPYTMTLRSSEYTGVVESWTWEAAWVDGNAKGLVSQVSPLATAGCMPAVLDCHGHVQLAVDEPGCYRAEASCRACIPG